MERDGGDKTIQAPKQKESTLKGSFFFFGLVFILALFLDQISKYFFVHAGEYFSNYAFAFSLPIVPWLMYLIYFAVIVAFVCYVHRQHRFFSVLAKLAWVLIFAGAVSNIVERILLGYVRDFIYITFFHWTGIYNLADAWIILGIVILILQPKQTPRILAMNGSEPK